MAENDLEPRRHFFVVYGSLTPTGRKPIGRRPSPFPDVIGNEVRFTVCAVDEHEAQREVMQRFGDRVVIDRTTRLRDRSINELLED